MNVKDHCDYFALSEIFSQNFAHCHGEGLQTAVSLSTFREQNKE
jgi:hypothetical protein